MQNLNEVFDSDSTYPTINLTPKAKVPQIIHVQAPGTNDIVVRLTSSDTIGTRVKAVKPGDKAVQVFLTSLSDKGNITDFKGGLGSDPIGAINTIFDTVVDICKQYRIEAILFRFPKSKMKGKDQVAQRVIRKLTTTRTGGRYTTLTEIEGLSKKFAFSLLYRKNTIIQDVPGIPNIDPSKFEKVESKVGDVYVDLETGDKVSAAEAIAQTIADEASKTTQQQVVAITKVSRQAALTAQGFSRGRPDQNMQLSHARKLDELIMSPPLVAGDETPSPFMDINKPLAEIDASSNIDKTKAVKWVLNNQISSTWKGRYGIYANVINHNMQAGMRYDDAHFEYTKIESDLDAIMSKLTVKNTYQSLADMVKYVTSLTIYQKLDNDGKYNLLSAFMSRLHKSIMDSVAFRFFETKGKFSVLTPETKPMHKAISEYTGLAYKDINKFLLGQDEPTSAVLKQIDALDKALEQGETLPKGVNLYRGQSVRSPQVSPIIESKYFTFRNYVSASVSPLIFTGGSFNVPSTSALDTQISVDMTDMNKDELDSNISSSPLTNESIGMVIKGAHKVKSINTCGISKHTAETEIILPRGLITRIDKVYRSGLKNYDGLAPILMELDIVPPSELTESVDVYDGDLFLETGELKIVKAGLFSEMYQQVNNTDAMETLAGLINLDNLSDKFK